jgi:transposase
MTARILGIDLGVRAAHVATLCDEAGAVIWTGQRFHARCEELAALSARVGDSDKLVVVMEPTRNAWVPAAAHFMTQGARVVLVPPERAADLRRYYAKHTKNDRLDSTVLARLPRLHPDGLNPIDGLGPAKPLRRAVRRRVKLVKTRHASRQRIDSLLDLLGPGYAQVLGASYNKTALTVLDRYGDPHRLRRLGATRLAALMRRVSGGQWGVAEATELINAATQAIRLWEAGGLDFDELAWDLTTEVRIIRNLDDEITRLEKRIEQLYNKMDPTGIVISAPGVGTMLAAGILGRLGDANRFASLAGVRAFSGMIPAVNQSGFTETRPGITKRGDAGLRRDLWIAADVARHSTSAFKAEFPPRDETPVFTGISVARPGELESPTFLIRRSPSRVHRRPQTSTQPQTTGLRFHRRPQPSTANGSQLGSQGGKVGRAVAPSGQQAFTPGF